MARVVSQSILQTNSAFLQRFATEITHEIYRLLSAVDLVRFSLASRSCLQSVQKYRLWIFQLFHHIGRFFAYDRALYREFRNIQLVADFLIVGQAIRSFVLRRKPQGTSMDIICRTRHLYDLITFLYGAKYSLEIEGTTHSRPRPKDYIIGTYMKFVRRDDGDQDWYIYVWATQAPTVALLLQSPTTADLTFASVSHVVVLYPHTTLHLHHAVKNTSAQWTSDADDGLAKAYVANLEDEEHFIIQQHPSWQSLMRRWSEFRATRLIGDRSCLTMPLESDGLDEQRLASSWQGLLRNSYCHRYRFLTGVGLEFSLLRQCHWPVYYMFSHYATDGVSTCGDDIIAFENELEVSDFGEGLSEDADYGLVEETPVEQRDIFSQEPMSRHPNAIHFPMPPRHSRVKRCRGKCQPILHEYELRDVSSAVIASFCRNIAREDALMMFFKDIFDGLEQPARPSPLIAQVINTGLAPVLKCLRFSPAVDVRLYKPNVDSTTTMVTSKVTVWISSIRSANSYCLPLTFEPYDNWDIPADRFHYSIRFGTPDTPMQTRDADVAARYTGIDNHTPYCEVAQKLGDIRNLVEDCVISAYGEVTTLQTLGMGDLSLIRRGRSLLLAYLFNFYDVFACSPNLHFSFSRSYRAQNDGLYISGEVVTAMCVHVEVPVDWPTAGSWPFQVKLNSAMIEELKEYMISVVIMQSGVPWVSKIDRGW